MRLMQRLSRPLVVLGSAARACDVPRAQLRAAAGPARWMQMLQGLSPQQLGSLSQEIERARRRTRRGRRRPSYAPVTEEQQSLMLQQQRQISCRSNSGSGPSCSVSARSCSPTTGWSLRSTRTRCRPATSRRLRSSPVRRARSGLARRNSNRMFSAIWRPACRRSQNALAQLTGATGANAANNPQAGGLAAATASATAPAAART